MPNWQQKFETAYRYPQFLEKYGEPEHIRRWGEVYESVALSDEQHALLRSFARDMNVLCLTGAWCGDCVMQCPILQRFAEATPRIHLRFIDRDADAEVGEALRVCGGQRVPVVVFLSEDFHECGRYGDRTISRYRKMASDQLGAACPTGLDGPDATAKCVVDDWLREFERIQLMLRLSPRLRQRYGD